MRDAGVDGNDEIHAIDQRGRVGKVLEIIAEVANIRTRGEQSCISGANFFLQADELDPVERERQRLRQCQAAIRVGQHIAAPHQAHTGLGFRAQFGLPQRDTCGISGEIRHVARNGVCRGVKCQRQTRDRAMHIKRGERRALRHHVRDAVQTRQQGLQCRGRFEHHRRTQIRNPARVAAKLQHVAQSLLGVEQHRLARDGFVTAPQRLRIITLESCDLILLPAPFIARPAACKIAQQQAVEREVPVCVGIVGSRAIERSKAAIASS